MSTWPRSLSLASQCASFTTTSPHSCRAPEAPPHSPPLVLLRAGPGPPALCPHRPCSLLSALSITALVHALWMSTQLLPWPPALPAPPVHSAVQTQRLQWPQRGSQAVVTDACRTGSRRPGQRWPALFLPGSSGSGASWPHWVCSKAAVCWLSQLGPPASSSSLHFPQLSCSCTAHPGCSGCLPCLWLRLPLKRFPQHLWQWRVKP